ncbi:MAG: leucine-rich repeat protein [Oscillospiraceae bacterium]|nr:leucine-rich repeat protein [Oscillospiraceae bacterium]
MRNKKIIAILLLLGMISPLGIDAVTEPSCITTVSAASIYEHFAYTIWLGEIQIEQYTGFEEEVTVPAVIDGLNVTRIDDYAFQSSKTLKSVILPEGLRSIGYQAFQDCKLLESVDIPDSVTEISAQAFDDTAIADSQQSGFVYVGNYVYAYKGSAYQDTELTLKDSAVGFCEGFYSTPVKTFNSVETVNIPSSMKHFSQDAIQYFSQVSEFNVSADNKYYSSKFGVLFNKDMSTLIRYPGRLKNDSYEVPEQTAVIGFSAFSDCKNLKHVTLPAQLKEIGEKAFSSTPLTEISLPSSLSNIKRLAFTDTGMSTVIIPESVKYLGYGSFAGCKNLKDVTVMNADCEIDNGQLSVAPCTISDYCPYPEAIVLYDYVDENGRLSGGIKGPTCGYSGTIHGYNGSTAQKYAKNCGYKFAEIGTDNPDDKNILYGDTDLNNIIEMNDLTTLSLFLIGDIDMNDQARLSADVTGDGIINLADLATLKQFLMKDDVHLGPVQWL